MNFFIKTSSNLYLFWNIGSLLMINMLIQIILGLFLSTYYFFYSNNMFINSMMIFYNLNFGWMMRFFHSNMTSLIFIMMFFHIMRSLIYKNYFNMNMWFSGLLMFILLMLISFLGYSLINSQMAYWASMVITNFISIIPLIGKNFMFLIWGNKFINNILLNRFFSLHFVLALMILFFSFIHLIILHSKKSSNPFSINNNLDQINLNALFIFKDMIFFLMFIYLFLIINMLLPIKMNNSDNFNMMLIFKTPNHIEPEWYFLFFYSILRSINNKLNGLIMMFLSIMIWFLFPMFNKTKLLTNKFSLLNKFIMFKLILIMMLMSFIGTKSSKQPYLKFIKFMIFMYFNLFLLIKYLSKFMNKI